MRNKLFLALVVMGILAVSCVNKDYDLDKLVTEMTVIPGLTTTIKIDQVLVKKLEEIVKEAPEYLSVPEEFILDLDGNFRTDILPDWECNFSMSQPFDIRDYVDGLDKVKTLSADATVKVENDIALPISVKINNKNVEIPAKGSTDFSIHYDNIMNVTKVEAEANAKYIKNSPVVLNKENTIKVTIQKAVLTLPDGLTINF